MINKTIFDFCNDTELRKSIIGDYSHEYYNTLPITVKMTHLREYAARVNNSSLFEEVTKTLRTEENAFEELQRKTQKEGKIIDY